MLFRSDSGRPYVPFLKSKGLLDDSVKIAPYFGSVAQLVAGPGYAAQGYTFSEPFLAKQQGVEVNELMMSQIGYNPYASLLITSAPYMQANSEVCQRMVAACVEGWQKYLQDPAATNERILSLNKQGMTKEALDYGVEALKPLCITNNDASQVGAMTPERWQELAKTLAALRIIELDKFDFNASYRVDLLPKPSAAQ